MDNNGNNESFNVLEKQGTTASIHDIYADKQPTSRGSEVSMAVIMVNQMQKILNARLLALIALLGALVIFFFVSYEPSPLKLWASVIYSVGVLWPVIALFIKRG